MQQPGAAKSGICVLDRSAADATLKFGRPGLITLGGAACFHRCPLRHRQLDVLRILLVGCVCGLRTTAGDEA
jgi:hypothetical protein